MAKFFQIFNFLFLFLIIIPLNNLIFAADVTFSLTEQTTPLNNLLGVNAGPVPLGDATKNPDVTLKYQNAGVKLVRNQGYFGPLDMAIMYPDKTKSPSDPNSYNFLTGGPLATFGSDYVFNSIISGGFEPYFRLGDSMNNPSPPSDNMESENWAQAAVNVLKHYRQGLWNGFNSNFSYVEIGNEPDNEQFWPKPLQFMEYCLLYEKTAPAIKAAFPELKAGGPGFAPGACFSPNGQEKVKAFLDYVKDKKLPLDFFSFHIYSDKVSDYDSAASFYRNELDSRGFTDVPLHVTEYHTSTSNYVYRAAAKGAALNTGFWISMQNNNISIATIYRGNDPEITFPEFYGIFFADGNPKKIGLAFQLWSEVYALQNRVNHTVSGNSDGLYFLAARDSTGNIGMLIANAGATTKTWTISDPVFIAIYKTTLKTVSDDYSDINISAPTSLEITIKPDTVQLLKFEIITPSSVQNLITCDLNNDNKKDIIKTDATGNIQYSTDLTSWINIYGLNANFLACNDINGDGSNDIAAVKTDGSVCYTLNKGSNWINLPRSLSKLSLSDFDGNGKSDILGLSDSGNIYISYDLLNWSNIPEQLSEILPGDFNKSRTGNEFAGLNSSGNVYYTNNLNNWINIPGTLLRLYSADLNNDGSADLAGLNSTNNIYYTTDLINWVNIPGNLIYITTGDLNGDFSQDIVGYNASNEIFYTTNLSTWTNIPGAFTNLVTGDFNADGNDDIAGIGSDGKVYYTANLSAWNVIE